MLYSCILCVALSLDLFVMSDNVCELPGEPIRNTFGCGCYFAVECYGIVGVCWACDPSVHLDVPSIGFVYVCVCRKLSPHLGV